MAKDGIADLSYVEPGFQPGRFPIIGAGELPFLVSDSKGGSLAVDAWYRKYADAEMKDVRFCLAFLHDPGSFHSRTKKIIAPSDIKGTKVHPANATIGAWITQLGGRNTQPRAPDVRDILEKSIAEAVTFPWGSIPLLGIDKVTKYHMDAPLYVTAFAFVFNKARYNEMSEAQKKVIDDHCTNEWAGRVATPWADFERAGMAKVKSDPANDVYAISAAEIAEWKKSAEPLEKTWADAVKKAGADPATIMKELEGHLASNKAAFERK
jgi:TRAP-type C4-dicarboxylate transport system substrate-binding protein